MTWVADREGLGCLMRLGVEVPTTDWAEEARGHPSRIGMLGPLATSPAGRSRRSLRLIEPRSHKGKSQANSSFQTVLSQNGEAVAIKRDQAIACFGNLTGRLTRLTVSKRGGTRRALASWAGHL